MVAEGQLEALERISEPVRIEKSLWSLFLAESPISAENCI